jgi:hypothetical protein
MGGICVEEEEEEDLGSTENETERNPGFARTGTHSFDPKASRGVRGTYQHKEEEEEEDPPIILARLDRRRRRAAGGGGGGEGEGEGGRKGIDLLGLRDEKGIFVIFSTRGCFYKFATITYVPVPVSSLLILVTQQQILN